MTHATYKVVTVTDASSGRKIYESTFRIPANQKVRIASLPEESGQGIYLIQYQIGNQKFMNHYLYGKAPFNLKEYKRLLQKTGLYAKK